MGLMDIRKRLEELSNKDNIDFTSKLIPNISRETILGIKTPVLKGIAKELIALKEDEEFLKSLPHYYFDENQVHAFILNERKDFSICIKEVEEFLPYIDNWATCDQLSPKVFSKHKKELLPYIDKWLKLKKTYTRRFGIGMLMSNFLGNDYLDRYASKVASLRSEEYYLNMMRAWYFATALAKNYEEVLPYFERKELDEWTHNKAIQKAIESYRVSDEHKEYLKTLKIKRKSI